MKKSSDSYDDRILTQTNSQLYMDRLNVQKTSAFNLNVNNPFIIFVPPLSNSTPAASSSSAMGAFASPLTTSLTTPLISQTIAADIVYLSAIQPLLNDDTQTITMTASTIITEADAIIVTSLNSISMTSYTECTIIAPLVSLSQDLQVTSLIRCSQIQCSQIQTDQLSVSTLSLPSATLSTFSDLATSSILIQINGAWWKIPIVPA